MNNNNANILFLVLIGITANIDSTHSIHCVICCRLPADAGKLNAQNLDYKQKVKKLLEFEHIVQVNDLGNESITAITRQQLWEGLVLRARSPEKFNPGLRCDSEDIINNEFQRTIKAGEASFREKVVLRPQQQICTETTAEYDQINAQSTTSIEEPQAGSLFVRFQYKRDLDENTDLVDVGEHLKAAYVQMDREAISLIRMLAESNALGAAIN